MSLLRISDYVRAPGFRMEEDGPNSGEWFRESVLVPALRAAIADRKRLTVELDGVAGYGSSFLEEAFGGLIRNRRATPAEVDRFLEVLAGSPLFETYRDLIYMFIANASKKLQTHAA